MRKQGRVDFWGSGEEGGVGEKGIALILFTFKKKVCGHGYAGCRKRNEDRRTAQGDLALESSNVFQRERREHLRVMEFEVEATQSKGTIFQVVFDDRVNLPGETKRRPGAPRASSTPSHRLHKFELSGRSERSGAGNYKTHLSFINIVLLGDFSNSTYKRGATVQKSLTHISSQFS